MHYSIVKDAILPRLGMGVSGVPKDEYGHADIQAAIEVMDECMKNGINYFDVGYNYLNGTCENFFYEAIVKRYPRESYYLADKMPIWDATTYSRVEEIYEEEKRRCGVDYFDFYYIQQVEEKNYHLAENSHAFEFIIKKKKEGELKRIGASFHCGPELFTKVLDKYGDHFDFVQIQLNFMDWYGKEINKIYEIVKERNLPIIVMSPLRGGFLTRTYSQRIRDILTEAGKENNRSFTDLAFGFVSSFENVACILSGMGSPDEVRQNVEFFNGKPLTNKELEVMHYAGKEMIKEAHINCSFCNYCSGCPSRIKIPKIIDLHNKHVISAKNQVYEIYPLIAENGLMPMPCINCGKCEKLCPQHLPVMSIMAKCSKALYGR